MGNPGYIYILINPSLKGLIKIGKTHKRPEERAKELSSATGVPTPFIPTFQMFFNDCDKAEKIIHSILESKGFKINPNREFFKLTLTEGVSILSEVYNSLENSELDNIGETNSLIIDLLDEAFEYYEGLGEKFIDYSKAFNLYEKAAMLGSSEAFYYMGEIFESGKMGNIDFKRALTFYENAATLGKFYSFSRMAWIYDKLGEFENASKAWNKYLNSLPLNNLSELDIITLDSYLMFYSFFSNQKYVGYELSFIDNLNIAWNKYFENLNDIRNIEMLRDKYHNQPNINKRLEDLMTYILHCVEYNIDSKYVYLLKNDRAELLNYSPKTFDFEPYDTIQLKDLKSFIQKYV